MKGTFAFTRIFNKDRLQCGNRERGKKRENVGERGRGAESMERIKYDQHHRHQQGWKSADFFLEHGSSLARAGAEEDINKKKLDSRAEVSSFMYTQTQNRVWMKKRGRGEGL